MTRCNHQNNRVGVLVTGGSGFIGTPMVEDLVNKGHAVTVLTRDCVKTAQHFSATLPDSGHSINLIDDLEKLDVNQSFTVIINLAGQGIADKRWTPRIKQQLLDSRLQTTHKLYAFVKRMKVKPDVFISGSALGYYGVGLEDQPINESGQPDQSFSSQLCVAWEQAAKSIEKLGVRTCYLRTGIVLEKNGGALAKMLPAFNWGLGGPLGSGEQWMSWIHRQDLIDIILFLIANDKFSGAVNGSAPNPVKNKAFSRTLGRVLHRPAWFPMPTFVLKLLMGDMAEELLLTGKPVVPAKLLDAGFRFQFPRLEGALQDILNGFER